MLLTKLAVTLLALHTELARTLLTYLTELPLTVQGHRKPPRASDRFQLSKPAAPARQPLVHRSHRPRHGDVGVPVAGHHPNTSPHWDQGEGLAIRSIVPGHHRHAITVTA